MKKKSTYLISELAQITGSEVIGDPDYPIDGIENIDAAGPSQAAFLDNALYQKILSVSKAGVVIISGSIAKPEGKNLLIHPTPTLAFQKLIELFIEPTLSGFIDIHPSSVIHPSAILGENVRVGPNVTIDQNVTIGDESVIEAGSYVGAGCSIGTHCHLYPNVVINNKCRLGKRVIIQSGAIIGAAGFGYFTNKQGKHHHLHHLGCVILEDDVEVGANTTIDRARFKATVVRQGAKIDNLVQIAHQVEIGQDNLIISQVGIAGSTKLGKRVIVGGQVGIAGHIEIADDVMFAARAGVSKSIPDKGIYSGAPVAPIKEFNKQFIRLRSIEKLINKVKHLEKQLNELQDS